MRLGIWEIILIVLLVFLLFGANKFPSVMKNMADGLNVFKKEIKEGDKKPAKKLTAAPKKRTPKKTSKKK